MSRFSRLALAALCLLLGAASPAQMRILLGNPNANLLVGLVGYWPCAEASGTTCADQSGQGNTATLFNTPTRSTPPPGTYGNAITLNGINSTSGNYLDVASSSLLQGMAALTICGRINLTAYDTGGAGSTFVMKATSVRNVGPSDPYQLYSLSINDAGKLFFSVSTGVASSRVSVTGTTTVGLAAWHLICGTYDHATLRIYIDGVAESATASTSITVGTNAIDVLLGEAGYAANNFGVVNGSIAGIRIWRRGLASSEIGQIYYGRL